MSADRMPTTRDDAPAPAAGLDETTHTVTVTVNGATRTATVPARRLLSDFLRHDLGLTGTHVGCEHGVCGCCTVLLDGAAVRACLLLAVAVRDREVTTIEGLAAHDGSLHPVQQAFHDHHGLQCGFCTPGFVLSACDFLADNPDPTRAEVREGMAGNLCRCTGYQNIATAVEAAAEAVRASGRDPRERCAGATSDAGTGANARQAMGATPNESGTTGHGPEGPGSASADAISDAPQPAPDHAPDHAPEHAPEHAPDHDPDDDAPDRAPDATRDRSGGDGA